VKSVDYFGGQENFIGIIVKSDQRTDYMFNSTEEKQIVNHKDMQFQGDYAIIGEAGNNPELFFLGNGTLLRKGNWSIEAEDSIVNVSMNKKDENWLMDVSNAVRVTIPSNTHLSITDMVNADRKIEMSTQFDGMFTVRLAEGKYQLKQIDN
jgi:hypothetical protein